VKAAKPWAPGVGGKLPSLMVVEPRVLTWAEKGKGKAAVMPVSSPVVKNPFHYQSTQDVYRTRNADASWSAVQGLVPPGDKYHPAGYTPVGRVAYKVVSPKARGLSAGRRLFMEYWGSMQVAPHTPQDSPRPGPRSAQDAALARIQLGEHAPLTVAAVHAHIVPGLQGPQIATAACMCEQPGQRTGLWYGSMRLHSCSGRYFCRSAYSSSCYDFPYLTT
jgi:hypothetical protein